MARAPRIGQGKRRLARDVGNIEAARFYRSNVASLLRRLSRERRWELWLAVTPGRDATPQGLWPFKGFVVDQGRGDLGERMGRLFMNMPAGPLVVIGSDIPGIESRHIQQAFRELGRSDWVIGPGCDGGYWLIGARRRPRLYEPFAGVRWSHPETLSDTLKNLEGRKVAFLEELDDVDEGPDLRSLRKKPRP
ncbi:MAG: TIGR04282 family arsenosugar biosynthesis glycosyltransferase [Kiloniellales bacterium]|nr:TIGR04282 family arsenosugar biosynthesis glycosyltransferase [Kiloniellales bacterium]